MKITEQNLRRIVRRQLVNILGEARKEGKRGGTYFIERNVIEDVDGNIVPQGEYTLTGKFVGPEGKVYNLKAGNKSHLVLQDLFNDVLSSGTAEISEL